MDFFEHQAAAQRRTKLLIGYYVMAVAAIVVAVYLVVAIGLASQGEQSGAAGLWNPVLFAWVAGLVGGVILLGSLFKIATLSSGGKSVAEMLGGRLLPADTVDGAERRLLNVVEEMAIAAGLPVPPVYVLDEDGINAFAAGFKPADAVIGVTRGCLEQLSRDELQGVVAHEFSHIINGDMRLDIRLLGVLFGILLISIIGQTLMRIAFYSGAGRQRSSRRDKGGGGALAMMGLGLALMVIGYIGVLFGRLIKSAVSRQREFLADASAVQYTRNPDGIAGALKRIGGFAGGSRVAALHAEEASHMFFANGLRSSWFSLLATHPPLSERIRRIQADFVPSPATPPRSAPPPVPRSAAGGGVSGLAAAAPAMAMVAGGAAFTDRIGAPDASHLDYAVKLIKAIPSQLRELLHSTDGAQAAVFCLLLSSDKQAFERQLDGLTRQVEEPVIRLMEQHNDAIGRLPVSTRMPMVDLALPALQQMDAARYRRFRQTIDSLVAADQQVSIFEFALIQTLMRNLEPAFGKPKPSPIRHHHLQPILPHCLPLLALLARYGNESDEQQAAADFAAGVAALGFDPITTPMPAVANQPVRTFADGLAVLRQADGPVKKCLLGACATAVTANGKVTVEEAELLRAVADSLECPVPPLAPTVER